MDSSGAYLNFIKHDAINNMDVHRDRKDTLKDENFVKIPIGQVPYGTTKCTYKMGLDTDGKVQRDRLNIASKTYPRNPTDHVSFDPPAQSRPFQKLFDKMIGSPTYDKNVKSSQPWVPKDVNALTINNRGSVTHNIINHAPNRFAGAVQPNLLDGAVSTKRMKGITEFGDLQGITAVNINRDHKNAISNNSNVFKRQDG